MRNSCQSAIHPCKHHTPIEGSAFSFTFRPAKSRGFPCEDNCSKYNAHAQPTGICTIITTNAPLDGRHQPTVLIEKHRTSIYEKHRTSWPLLLSKIVRHSTTCIARNSLAPAEQFLHIYYGVLSYNSRALSRSALYRTHHCNLATYRTSYNSSVALAVPAQ